jgi:ribonuclease R
MSKQKKNPKIKGNKLSAFQLRSEILKLFRRHPRKRLNPKQVARKLKITNNRDSVQDAMDKLTANKDLIALGDYKYKLNFQANEKADKNPDRFMEGIVDMTRSGDAYIVCEGQENDVHVSGKYLHTALNGDKVKIKTWRPPGRRKLEGEVVKVLERSRTHFMGTLWKYPRYALVSVDANPPLEVIVDIDKVAEIADEYRVVVRIDEWESAAHGGNPSGTVTTVLGLAGSHDIEMKSILINNGFELEFPEQALKEANSFSDTISPQEIARRRDFREITTFTIDPADAKDFDDALSLRYLENGEIEVGVHIADVTHYIKENSPLDKEALDRSTSVYLVDRVLPMLPERLSNGLCSLRPHEDRLAYSAVFTFNKNFSLTGRWFGRTVIHSDRRFTYNEAQEVIDSGQGDYVQELQKLNKMAKYLRKRRYKNGAINFETDEVKFRLDEDGSPVDVYIKERKDAHLLIEDFMLLANREVASYIANKGRENEIPYIYRIHDEPDPDKVEELARFAREMGFDMNISSPRAIASSFNRLAEAAQKDPGLKLLSPIAIRTMAKAAYSSDNIGHYGLGFDFYTHFTSPIRRYSDVLAHRLLDKNLGKETFRVNKLKLEEQCSHISQQERRAVSAERESVKYKQVEYIGKHLGEEFTGYISGMIDTGIFVELQHSRIEGKILFENLDEPFDVADSRLSCRGLYSKLEYKIGQEVKVRIVRTDLAKRQVEMDWIRDGVAISGTQTSRGRNKARHQANPRRKR